MTKLILTYLALMALLGLTLLASQVDLGAWQTALALLIAAVKAGLVAWIFMELASDALEVRIVALASLIWVFFFYFLGALDVGFRVPMPGSSWM